MSLIQKGSPLATTAALGILLALAGCGRKTESENLVPRTREKANDMGASLKDAAQLTGKSAEQAADKT